MKIHVLTVSTLFASLILTLPAQAENLDHIRQLLATKQCPNCDLTEAGLVFSQLVGANLAGANLAGANLSQANLAGADLTGADLRGTIFYGSNLTGAKLSGANLQGSDLRRAALSNADLNGAQVGNAAMLGVVGLDPKVGDADEFYRLAMEAGQRRNYLNAIENFNQSLLRKPEFAAAHLGRAMARLELGDQQGAIQDSEQAATLFVRQGDTANAKTTQDLVVSLKTPAPQKRRSNIGQTLVTVVGGLLQLFLTR